ncbi:heterokaryon incompatibility protein-domain-containing protein [Aspergillus floccosus]
MAMMDLFTHGIEISAENVDEICARKGIPAQLCEGLRCILARLSVKLTTAAIEELKERQDCPLCRIKLFALTGPSQQGKEGPRETPWNKERRGFILGSLGTRVVFLEDSPGSPWVPRAGIAVEKSRFNTALIGEWLHSCEAVHGSQCSPQPLNIGRSSLGPSLKTFRLVDVVNGCVVETPIHREYFALSYVWGRVEQVRLFKANKDLLMRPGGLAGMASQLPKTIRDAIDLVRLLGKQYLWVDCLCLIQDDEEDLADSIGYMDLVYRGATATIIAASGQDADAGLPGVHPNSRHAAQIIEEIAPGVRMTVLRELDEFLEISKYSTRGWT